MTRFFALAASFLLPPLLGSAGESVDFAGDIRPILSENCAFCHGPDDATREAGLRLDTPEGIAEVVSAGDLKRSELFQRVTAEDGSRMPPAESHRELSDGQIAMLRRWIEEGGSWERHWSFRPIVRPQLPRVASKPAAPVRNPIDAFVRESLQVTSLVPAPEANRATLIRRLSLDLTGLPPSSEQVRAFLADPRPDAYERLVDRLLQSPAYGERMTWDWLDAARYADTNGYQGDRERTMWPWRDWVVQAFNDDLPYDQFTILQLAGDRLPNATEEQILATGFCRNHMINGEGGRIAEENRVEYVMDMTETMGTVWLGLTLNCCRCHDHKYDPITNQEYYRLFAFFNQTPVNGGGGNPATPPVLAVPTEEQQQRLNTMATKLEELGRRIAALDEALGPQSSADQRETPKDPQVTDAADVDAGESAELKGRRDVLVKQRDQLRERIPKVMVMDDRETRRPTYVLQRGLYNKPADEVTSGLPAFLSSPESAEEADRLALARWLVSDENPLTARVTVNRFWQQFFGVGLVKTTEDFGNQGEIPVQRDLLNWLAAEFRERQWDVKHLVRLIVTSHTYRQSSKIGDPSAYEQDPENRYLARGARYRMPAWMIRDQALAISGLLSPAAGGAAVNSYQPEGVWEEASFGKKTYRRDAGEPLYRRSLYIFWRRIIAPTTFFDNASRQTCTVRSGRTNTPLHALQTFNNVAYVEAARWLAQLAMKADAGDDRQTLDWVMHRAIARTPSDAEAEILLGGLNRTRSQYLAAPQQAEALLASGDSPRERDLDPVEHASWTSLCLAVLNLDETLTRE